MDTFSSLSQFVDLLRQAPSFDLESQAAAKATQYAIDQTGRCFGADGRACHMVRRLAGGCARVYFTT